MMKCSNLGGKTMDNQTSPRELVAIYSSVPEKNKDTIDPRRSISDCLIQRPRKRQEVDNSKIKFRGGRGNNPYKFIAPNVIYDRQHKYTKAEMFQNCITNSDDSKTLDTLSQVIRQINPSLQKNQMKRDRERRANLSTILRNTQQCLDHCPISYDTNLSSFSESKHKSDSTCVSCEHYCSKSMNQHLRENVKFNEISDSINTSQNIDNYCSTSMESLYDLLRTDSNVYSSKTLSSKAPKYCSSDLLFLEDIPTYDRHKEKNQQPHSSVKKKGQLSYINHPRNIQEREKIYQKGVQLRSTNHPQNIEERGKIYQKHISLPSKDVQYPSFDKQIEIYKLQRHLPMECENEVVINQTQYIDEYGNTCEKPMSLPPSACQKHILFPQRENTQGFSSSKPPVVLLHKKPISNPPVPQKPTCIDLPSKPQLPVCIQTLTKFALPNIFNPGVQNSSRVTNPVNFQETTQLQHLAAYEQRSQNPNILQTRQQQYKQQNFFPQPTNVIQGKDPSNNAVKCVDFQDFLQRKPCSQNESPVQNALRNSSLFVSQHHPTIESNCVHQNIFHTPLYLSDPSKDTQQFDCILHPAAHTNCDVKQQLFIPADSSRESKYEICNTDEQVQTSEYKQLSAPQSLAGEHLSCTNQSQSSEISHKTESSSPVSSSVNQCRSCGDSLKSEIANMDNSRGKLESTRVSNKQLDKKQSSQIQTSNSLLCYMMEKETQMSKERTNTGMQVEDIFLNAKPQVPPKIQLLQQMSDNIILQSTYSSKGMEENKISSEGKELCRIEEEEGKLSSPIPWKNIPPYPAETHYLEIRIPLNMKQTMNVYQPKQNQYESGTQVLQDQTTTERHLRFSGGESNTAGIDSRQEHNSQIVIPILKDSTLEPKQHDSCMKQPIIIHHKVIPALTDKSCKHSAHSQSQSIVQKKKRLNVSFKESRSDENMKEDFNLPKNGTKNAGSDTTAIYEVSSRNQSIINCHFINAVSYDNQNCSPEIHVLHNAANTSFSLRQNSDNESTELITVKLSQRDIALKNDESEQKNKNIKDIFLKEDYCEITSIDSNDILLKNNYLNTAETVNNDNSLMSEKIQSICKEETALHVKNCISTPDTTRKIQNERNETHRNVGCDPTTPNKDLNMVDNDGTPNSENNRHLSKEQISKSNSYKQDAPDKQNCLLQYFKRQPAWVENVVTKVTQDLLKKLGVTSNTSISMCNSYTIPLHTLPEEQSRPTTVQMLTEGSTPTIHTLPDGSTCKTSPSNVCVVPAGRKHLKKSSSDTCQIVQQKSSNKYLLLDHVIPRRMLGNTNNYDDESSTTLNIFQQSLAYTPVVPLPPQYTVMPYTEKHRGMCRSKTENRSCSSKSTQYSIKSTSSVFSSERPVVLCGCKSEVEPKEVRNDISVPPTIFAQHTESTIGSVPEPPPEEEFRPSHIFDLILQKIPPPQPSCGVPDCNPSLCDPPCIIPSQSQPTMHEHMHQEQYVRPPDTGPVETTYYPSADQPLRHRIRKGPAPKKTPFKERNRVVREFIDANGIKRIRHICRRGGKCIGKPIGRTPNIFATKPQSTVGVMPYVPVISSVKRRYCRYCTLEICPGEEISRRHVPTSGVQMMEKELLSTMLDINPYKRPRCTLDSYSNWEFPTVRE